MGLRNGSLVCDICCQTLFAFSNFQQALKVQDSDTRDLTQGYTYTQTWKQIDDGENAGCNWCDFLWGDILEYRKSRIDQLLRTEEWPSDDDEWKITVRFHKGKEPPHNTTLQTYIGDDFFPSAYDVHTNHDDPAASLVAGRNIIWQVASPKSYSLAKECIEDCKNNHTCQSAQRARFPTRVVNCADPLNPRLVSGLGHEGPFAALSYVWGQAQPHSTCSTNINSYFSRIDISILPKTIVDAITATHSLGIQYLWTDTLCIIQDSPEDKHAEIPQMCNIYQNAFVTIIAASSQKAGDGFLQDRKNPASMELPFWLPSGQLGTIYVRDQERAPQNDLVNQRAWCFQERMLASRALIYASHTLQFQCRRGIKNVGAGNNFWTDKRTDELRIPDQTSNLDERRTWAVWKDILAEYTRRSLTSPADKLVALSGVAQAFQRCWPCDTGYIAGLWRHALAQDITWHRSRASARRARPQRYRAPTWSWAASDGPIDVPGWPPNRIEPIVNIRTCEAIPAVPSLPFGEIQSGELVADAIVRSVSWEPPSSESTSRMFELCAGKRRDVGYVYHDYADCEATEGFAVVVGEFNKAVLHNLIGLVVLPVRGMQGTYSRIGIFNVHAQIVDPESGVWSDEPFADIDDWTSTPFEVITVT